MRPGRARPDALKLLALCQKLLEQLAIDVIAVTAAKDLRAPGIALAIGARHIDRLHQPRNQLFALERRERVDEHPPKPPPGHRIARIQSGIEIGLHQPHQFLRFQTVGRTDRHHGPHPVRCGIGDHQNRHIRQGQLKGRPHLPGVGIKGKKDLSHTLERHGRFDLSDRRRAALRQKRGRAQLDQSHRPGQNHMSHICPFSVPSDLDAIRIGAERSVIQNRFS